MGEDGSGDPDDLPPPYRPWQGTGVPQPGADRPSAAPDVSRRGRVPPPPVPPAYPTSSEPASPQWYTPAGQSAPTPRPLPTGRVLPAAPSAPVRPARARVDRSLLAPILALLAAGTSWLPWLKSPVAGLFDLSGSGLERTVNAWDLPARAVWSYHAPRGGPSLGWLIVGIAAGVIVLGFLGARTVARWLGAVEAALAVMFLVQLTRIVEDSPSIGSTDIGVTDLAGIGVYLLLIIGCALVLAPRA